MAWASPDMTIIVAGALGTRPFNAGGAWVRLSWVRGLQKLGFDVMFVEQIAPDACVDSRGARALFSDSVNLAYFERVTSRFGLSGSAALICGNGEQIFGVPRGILLKAAARAALLINISGHLRWGPVLEPPAVRAFVDLDPGFTQFWAATGDDPSGLLRHDVHFTIAENIGTEGCLIPQGGLRWHAVRQPVVLDDWPAVPVSSGPVRFTTVGALRGPFAAIEHDGRRYGLKIHELRRFEALPSLVDAPFELAMAIHPGDEKDRQRLLAARWHVVDPVASAPDPDAFRRYVQESGAEFSVAQGIYVDTASGWFSDRTVRYLASGRPALVQDTGFSRHLPTGTGLVAFRTLEEAAEGARVIVSDHARHCRVARDIAEACFSSDVVLTRMLAEIGVTA